jgi:hypothetical protein
MGLRVGAVLPGSCPSRVENQAGRNTWESVTNAAARLLVQQFVEADQPQSHRSREGGQVIHVVVHAQGTTSMPRPHDGSVEAWPLTRGTERHWN